VAFYGTVLLATLVGLIMNFPASIRPGRGVLIRTAARHYQPQVSVNVRILLSAPLAPD
jgi:hypothetical protein